MVLLVYLAEFVDILKWRRKHHDETGMLQSLNSFKTCDMCFYDSFVSPFSSNQAKLFPYYKYRKIRSITLIESCNPHVLQNADTRYYDHKFEYIAYYLQAKNHLSKLKVDIALVF